LWAEDTFKRTRKLKYVKATEQLEDKDHLKAARFIRVKDVTRIFGLKRGFLYHMTKRGLLKPTVIRVRRGARGTVLYKPQDIESLINKLSKEQAHDITRKNR
jgi:hypothetical protein